MMIQTEGYQTYKTEARRQTKRSDEALGEQPKLAN